MSTEIGFGIVGAGMVARYHARAIAEAPGARLAAICRADAARADEAAAELGVPCEASFEALIERPDVDAVCLCSPSGLHAEQAVAAARAARHVLVEKPMALRLADADAMIAACRDAGVRLGVVLQRRTDPDIRALRDRGPVPLASAPSGTPSSCRISSPRSVRVATRWWMESRAADPWRWSSPSTRPPASAARIEGIERLG